MVFFFNDTATTEIYTLSLHDALPISSPRNARRSCATRSASSRVDWLIASAIQDRKSTRLNSSHSQISYAVFCLKKKTPANCYKIARRDADSIVRYSSTLTANMMGVED